MSSSNKPLTARCPECDSRIYFDRRPDAGEVIACPECDTLLEVISVSPLRLDWASEEPVGATGNWNDNYFGDQELDLDEDFEDLEE